MQGYINTLRKEVAATDIHLVQLKLGIFDFGTPAMSRALVSARDVGREELMGKFVREDAEAAVGVGSMVKGSPLRELYGGVFDAIVRERGRSGTMFVGRGSRSYDLVSGWVPAGVVGWMLKGMGGIGEREQQQRRRQQGQGQLRTDDEKVRFGGEGSSAEWKRVAREMGASGRVSAGED